MSNTAVLFIDPSSSECGACGGNAHPYEKAHTMRLGWAAVSDPDSPLRKGCGATFDAVSSRYVNFDGLYDRIKEMRPDLPFVEYPDFDHGEPSGG